MSTRTEWNIDRGKKQEDSQAPFLGFQLDGQVLCIVVWRNFLKR